MSTSRVCSDKPVCTATKPDIISISSIHWSVSDQLQFFIRIPWSSKHRVHKCFRNQNKIKHKQIPSERQWRTDGCSRAIALILSIERTHTVCARRSICNTGFWGYQQLQPNVHCIRWFTTVNDHEPGMQFGRGEVKWIQYDDSTVLVLSLFYLLKIDNRIMCSAIAVYEHSQTFSHETSHPLHFRLHHFNVRSVVW